MFEASGDILSSIGSTPKNRELILFLKCQAREENLGHESILLIFNK